MKNVSVNTQLTNIIKNADISLTIESPMEKNSILSLVSLLFYCFIKYFNGVGDYYVDRAGPYLLLLSMWLNH